MPGVQRPRALLRTGDAGRIRGVAPRAALLPAALAEIREPAQSLVIPPVLAGSTLAHARAITYEASKASGVPVNPVSPRRVTLYVTPLAGGLGFYAVTVAAASTKEGCGTEGSPVSFLLLAGEVDEGSPAAQTQAWQAGTQRLDLSSVPDATFGTFVGELPTGPGLGVLRWTGASATPIEQAVATIPRDVESVSYFDVPTQSYRVYVPAAPDFVSRYLLVDRDDIIVIRVR